MALCGALRAAPSRPNHRPTAHTCSSRVAIASASFEPASSSCASSASSKPLPARAYATRPMDVADHAYKSISRIHNTCKIRHHIAVLHVPHNGVNGGAASFRARRQHGATSLSHPRAQSQKMRPTPSISHAMESRQHCVYTVSDSLCVSLLQPSGSQTCLSLGVLQSDRGEDASTLPARYVTASVEATTPPPPCRAAPPPRHRAPALPAARRHLAAPRRVATPAWNWLVRRRAAEGWGVPR